MTTLRHHLSAVLTWALLAAVAAGALAGVFGVRLLPVLTGSMSPYAPAGSLVLTVPASGNSIAEGDAVAFRPPPQYRTANDRPVFHRVQHITHAGAGSWMSTKGDANFQPDPWQVTLTDADLARAVIVVPHLGHLLAGGRHALALMLAGIIALTLLTQVLIDQHVKGERCRCPSQTPKTPSS